MTVILGSNQSIEMENLTAVILCGGRGERLRPFTDHLPKALVPLGGKPLLWHLVSHLDQHGVGRFIFCTGYMAEAVDDFLSGGLPGGGEVLTVNSGADASMTRRLSDAAKHVSAEALVCYGDTVANVDIGKLQEVHRESSSEATLTVHPLRSPFGLVQFSEDGRVNAFQEKPELPYWINIGYLLCSKGLLGTIDPDREDMAGLLEGLAASGALNSYPHRGKHLTVNTEKERAHAETEVIDMFTMP